MFEFPTGVFASTHVAFVPFHFFFVEFATALFAGVGILERYQDRGIKTKKVCDIGTYTVLFG